MYFCVVGHTQILPDKLCRVNKQQIYEEIKLIAKELKSKWKFTGEKNLMIMLISLFLFVKLFTHPTIISFL